MNVENYVGPEEVREYLAYENVETIYRLCQRGLPHVRIGRQLRFKLSEVDRWLEKQAGEGQSADVVSLRSMRTG